MERQRAALSQRDATPLRGTGRDVVRKGGKMEESREAGREEECSGAILVGTLGAGRGRG